MDINKQLTTLDPVRQKDFLVLHVGDLKASRETVNKLQALAKTEVLILPDQNTPDNFEEIKKVYPQALGKMTVNGEDAHPFAKFLRRSSNQVYDHEMLGAKKTIPFSVFRKEGDRYTYYSEERIKDLIAQLEK
jgi:hypothetical protein